MVSAEKIEQIKAGAAEVLNSFAQQSADQVDLGQISGNRAKQILEKLSNDPRFQTIEGTTQPQQDFEILDREKPNWTQSVFAYLKNLEQALKDQRKNLQRSVEFSTQGKQFSGNPQLFASEYIVQPHERSSRLEAYRLIAIKTLLTRLLDTESNKELRGKRALATEFHLQYPSYVYIDTILDPGEWQAAVQSAQEYIKSVWKFSVKDVEAVSSELKLSKTHESLVRLVDNVMRNTEGEVDFVDSNVFVLPEGVKSSDLRYKEKLGFISVGDKPIFNLWG